MALARVQFSTPITTTGTGTIAPAWPAATATGNLLIAIISQTRQSSGITFTAPSGWVQFEAITVANDAKSVAYYIEQAASRSGAETFTSTSTGDMTAMLYEGSGFSASVANQSKSNSGTGTTLRSGETVTSGSNAALLIVGCLTARNVPAQTGPTMNGTASGGSLATLGNVSSAAATAADRIRSYYYEYISPSGGGTGKYESTISSSKDFVGLVVMFVPGTAPTMTGTGAITVAKATFSAAGTMTQNATGTGGFAAAAASLAGATSVSGTGGIAAAAASLAVAGTFTPTTITGTAAFQGASASFNALSTTLVGPTTCDMNITKPYSVTLEVI